MNEQVEILKGRAELLRSQGRRREAVDVYRQLLELDPGLTDCWYNLGYLLKAEGRFDAALDAYSEALIRGVSDPEEVHLNRAVIYSDCLRRDEAAEAELRAALAANPHYVPALLNLGNLCEERGERREAVDFYERIVSGEQGADAQEPLRYEALGRLLLLRPPRDTQDALLERVREVASSNGKLDAVTRANLFFCLGRALDGLGEYDAAFAAFDQANRHARSTGRTYNRARAKRAIGGIVDAFSGEPGSAEQDPGGTPEPVFICGMFRSGSTLVEQVLAAHPRVIAGGELGFFPGLANRLPAPFPASAGALATEQVSALAREYRACLLRLFPQARRVGMRVTDKRPDNFLLIGLIKRVFPAAKIVHTIRNPLDNCLSIYFQHLQQSTMSYSSDLGDLGDWYGQYRRLMAHWRNLFPDDILDWDYDAFVREPQPRLATLLEFLGLERDDRCLDFHRLPNTVKTASYWQVRRPLYANASGRWRHYSKHIAPLRNALHAAGVDAA